MIGNRIGIKRCSDGTMHILVNGEDLGVAASNIPKNVFAVIDIFGMIVSVSVTSSASTDMLNSLISPSLPSELEERRESVRDEDKDTMECTCFEFSGNHGKNILLSNNNMTAERTASYNQGIVVLPNILPRNKLLQVRIDRVNSRWSASLMLGVLGFCPERFNFPVSAMSLKKHCVLIHGDGVYYCGTKVKEKYGSNIDSLKCGDSVGILVDEDSCLHMYINGVDQGIASKEIPNSCYAFIDLYGQCEQVTIVMDDNLSPSYAVSEDREKADLDDVVKEKHGRNTVITESNVSRNCEYQNVCSRVRASLGLPESYFDSQFTVCYCETCHKIRGEDSYHKKGEPPKEYAVPCGWCRFNLRLPSKTHSPSMFDRWHRAYCGTKIENVRRILDSGDIHIPVNTDGRSGSILQPQPASFTEKSHPDDCDTEQVFLSPTVRYAGSNDFAPKHKFTDPKTKKIYYVRVAFQVWIKPGSYKVGPLQSTSVYEQIDPRFNNSELEWSTKERGSVKLYSLLVKLE